MANILKTISTKGTHLILDIWDAAPTSLSDLEYVKSTLLDATRKAGATIIGYKFHRFHPEGVSGVILIAESHISIHTWPDKGYASIDIYTCGDKCFPDAAKSKILEAFKARKTDLIRIERGLTPSKEMQIVRGN